MKLTRLQQSSPFPLVLRQGVRQAMGASVSVTAANYDRVAGKSCLLQSNAKFFSLLHGQLLLRNSVQHFGFVHYTHEQSRKGHRLPFLDVLVKECDGLLSFRVNQKDTNTGRYLNFHTVHPDVHKRSVAASLFNHANRICTKAEDRFTNLDHVRDDFSAFQVFFSFCPIPSNWLIFVQENVLPYPTFLG